MKLLKLSLFSLPILFLNISLADASNLEDTKGFINKNPELFQKINQFCMKDYNNEQLCNCVLIKTAEGIMAKNNFQTLTGNDTQIKGLTMATELICENELKQAKLNY